MILPILPMVPFGWTGYPLFTYEFGGAQGKHRAVEVEWRGGPFFSVSRSHDVDQVDYEELAELEGGNFTRVYTWPVRLIYTDEWSDQHTYIRLHTLKDWGKFALVWLWSYGLLVKYRCIRTLQIWGLADVPPGNLPAWGDVYLIKRVKGTTLWQWFTR